MVFFDPVGIYARIDGELRLIVDSSSNPSASSQTMGTFVSPRISGENVVFPPQGPLGIYTHINGTLKRVMDTSVRIPGHEVPFLNFGFGEPGISGTSIAFAGGGIGTNGVYVLTKDPPAVPGQSDWSVMVMTLTLLAAASAIIVRRRLSHAPRTL